MIEPIVGISEIKNDNDDEPNITLNLTPRNGIPHKVSGLSENEEMVLECVKKGDCAFAGVLLETGFDKDLLDIEREVYDVQKELSLVDLEISLCICQKQLLTDYTDNIYQSNDPRQLGYKLFSGLLRAIEDKAQEAVDKDLKEEAVIKAQFRLFKTPDIDPIKLKLEYLQYFHEYNFNIEKTKISELQELLKDKIEMLLKKREETSCSLDDIRFVKREIDKIYFDFNNRQLQIYKDLVTNTQTFKIVPNYCVNPDVMREILQFKVSPNLIDPETGETLLHIALANGHKEMVKLLIARRADPLKPNRKGDSALKAAAMKDDSEFLEFLTEALKKTDFLCDQLRQSYINELQKYLKELPKAKVILDTYAETLLARKHLPLIFRIILFIETRIDSRQKDFDIYYRKLKEACEALDPQIFFNEVQRRAPNAERGMLHRSAGLHDPLLVLLADFMRRFDRLGFTQAKEALIITDSQKASSPIVKRQADEIKSTKEENNKLKAEAVLLKEENISLKLKMNNILEASAKNDSDNSPRCSEAEVKMADLPAKPITSFFKP